MRLCTRSDCSPQLGTDCGTPSRTRVDLDHAIHPVDPFDHHPGQIRQHDPTRLPITCPVDHVRLIGNTGNISTTECVSELGNWTLIAQRRGDVRAWLVVVLPAPVTSDTVATRISVQYRGRSVRSFMGFNFGTEAKAVDLWHLHVGEFARLSAAVAFEFRLVWALAGAGLIWDSFGANNRPSQLPARPA